MICRDCKNEYIPRIIGGKQTLACVECVLRLMSKLPDPDCKMCGGDGERAIAGRYVFDCQCSIFDDIPGIKELLE